MFVAWTTVATRADAEGLATRVIELKLAACVQIEGPVTSHFRWAGKIHRAEEFRLMFKVPAGRLVALENHVLAHHPYSTPEWIAVEADRVAEKYLSWAIGDVQSPPL
jgi:periplasmic divalent cation tolerance protein